MSKSARTRTPSYRRHKPTGQAIVSLSGKIFYLGLYGTEASKKKYDRLIAEWLANGRRLPRTAEQGLTVGELVLRYWDFAHGYYVKDGELTKEIPCIRLAVRPLNDLYAETPVEEFGPLALKTVRERMIARDNSRKVINNYVGRIKRIFRWGVENELVAPEIYQALQAVAGLRKGRSAARETEPIAPVDDAYVDAVRPWVTRQVWAMMELQRLTGMRSGEVVLIRGGDLDMTGTIWCYTPRTHKTAHHGREKRIWLGPRAQKVLRPFLKADLQAFVFGGFESWSETVGGILEVNGFEKWRGNEDAWRKQADPASADVEAFVEVWRNTFRGKDVTPKELRELAERHDLFERIFAKPTPQAASVAFGQMLRQQKDKPVGDWFIRRRAFGHTSRYHLDPIDAQTP